MTIHSYWMCFHCAAVFLDRDRAKAREHFGGSEFQQAGCQIDLAEYRRMEEQYRRCCEEDTDVHRALHAKDSEMRQAVLRAEEAGYARGLADAKKFPEELGLRPAQV